MLSGVCPLPSSHMVERFGRWLFMFLYEKTTKLCHSWSIKTNFYCYRRTVAPDFLGGVRGGFVTQESVGQKDGN